MKLILTKTLSLTIWTKKKQNSGPHWFGVGQITHACKLMKSLDVSISLKIVNPFGAKKTKYLASSNPNNEITQSVSFGSKTRSCKSCEPKQAK